MYTPQQMAKPLGAYDSYIQQSLATREALRVKPHAYTPKNELLPPTAGISSNEVTDAPTEQPININPIEPKTKATTKQKIISKPDVATKNATTITFAVSSPKGLVTPHINTTGVLCRGGPAE